MTRERCMTIVSPLGRLLLAEDGEGLSRVMLAADVPDRGEGETSPLLEEAARQLQEYFAGRRHEFELALHPAGTAFQQRVWQALREIPYGETRSYKDIARIVGVPQGFRAVGMANHRNPLLIVTPCHRVIAADGTLRGFACGLECKRFLLRFERENMVKR